MSKGIPHIDMLEAGADLCRAHNRVMITGAFDRNYDNCHYSDIRSEFKHTQWRLLQGIEQMRTAAALPDYVKGMGW